MATVFFGEADTHGAKINAEETLHWFFVVLGNVYHPQLFSPKMPDQHIDLSYLERFCQSDRSRMAKYIALYLAEAPAIISQLEQASAEMDATRIAASAHSMRPMMHQMGALQLMSMLTTIEERAEAEESTALTLLVKIALKLANEVDMELRSALARITIL